MITKEEAYDILTKAIATSFAKNVDKMFGNDFEKGQFSVAKNLVEIIKDLDSKIKPSSDGV